MNKTELIAEIEDLFETKAAAKAAVDCMLKTITNALKKGESVTIPKFGTFKVQKREKRQGRNPRTGEVVTIKAKNVPKFVPGKAMKAAIN